MVTENIHLKRHDYWSRKGNTFVRGCGFKDDLFISSSEMANEICNMGEFSEICSFLENINGFFSIIHNTDDDLFLASDHIRTYPLYYSIIEQEIYVSDLPSWIDDNANHRGYDPIAATECLFLSYVTGNKTLSKDIKQIQAGELIRINKNTDFPKADSERYYIFSARSSSKSPSIEEFDKAILNAFERFISVADERPILLGLSGGKDSKLIALTLYRLGYDNVITWTYGESELNEAKTIAKDLEFDHIEIKHDHSDYRRAYTEGLWDEMIDSVGYLSSIPYIDRILRYRQLKEKMDNNKKPIVTFGRNPFESAAHPTNLDYTTSKDKSEFLESIFSIHYENWVFTKKGLRENTKQLLKTNILKNIPVQIYESNNIEHIDEAIKAYERWYWQERTPKRLIESSEMDFVDLPYRWYPYWDNEILRFHSYVSNYERLGRKFFKRYVNYVDEMVRGSKSQKHEVIENTDESIGEKIFQMSKKAVLLSPNRISDESINTYKKIVEKDRKPYESDPRFGVIDSKEFEDMNLQFQEWRSFWYILIYRDGYFDLPVETELDRALQ